MAIAMFAETLDNSQHSSRFIPESRSCFLHGTAFWEFSHRSTFLQNTSYLSCWHWRHGVGLFLKNLWLLSCFYRIRGIISLNTEYLHWALYWSSWIHPTPWNPSSVRCIVILFSVVSYHEDFKLNLAWKSHFPHSCYMSYPFHTLWFNHLNNSSIIYNLHQILLGYQIKDYEIDGACSTHGKMRNLLQIFVCKPEGKSHLEDLGVDGKIILKCIFGK
jgi:hypothetical protein